MKLKPVVLGGAALAGAAAVIAKRRAATPAETIDTSRTSRTIELAKLGTSTGASYAKMTAKSVGATDERKAELRSEFELQTAEQTVERLGNMKGALMKIGQMASYLDQGLPEPVRQMLAELQTNAPPMSTELVYKTIESQLGSPPNILFRTFDDTPLASASIGQVHRAVTQDGRHVAVKVQYPGVDKAIASDLENSDVLLNAMGYLFPGLEPGPIVAELRDRLSEELDYQAEAAHQSNFADYYAGHPTIYVPRVLPEFTSRRILTSEYAHGASWQELLTWSQDEQNLAAETMYRYAFGGIYRLGAFNGDPHPGNYVFQPGGKVAFLDYGLCKVFTPDEVKSFERMIQAMVFDEDPTAIRKVLTDVGVLKDNVDLSDDDINSYFRHFFEQVLTKGTTTMTPEYASESIRRFFAVNGPHASVLKSVTLPSFMVVIQRINLGLFALFGELHATGNWRAIAEEIWPFVDGPPSTAAGQLIRQWEITRGHRPA